GIRQLVEKKSSSRAWSGSSITETGGNHVTSWREDRWRENYLLQQFPANAPAPSSSGMLECRLFCTTIDSRPRARQSPAASRCVCESGIGCVTLQSSVLMDAG